MYHQLNMLYNKLNPQTHLHYHVPHPHRPPHHFVTQIHPSNQNQFHLDLRAHPLPPPLIHSVLFLNIVYPRGARPRGVLA